MRRSRKRGESRFATYKYEPGKEEGVVKNDLIVIDRENQRVYEIDTHKAELVNRGPAEKVKIGSGYEKKRFVPLSARAVLEANDVM